MNRYFVLSAASFVALVLLPDQRIPFRELSSYMQAAYLLCAFGIVAFALIGVGVHEGRKGSKTAKPAPALKELEPSKPASRLWRLFQGGTVLAIVASNIQWHWTPNPYVPIFLGVLFVLLVTGLAAKWSDKRAGLPTVPSLNPLAQFRRGK